MHSRCARRAGEMTRDVLTFQDVQRLRIVVPARVRAAWANVPKLRCRGLCQASCRVWQATPSEVALLGKVAVVRPQGAECPLLVEGRCSVYPLRPLVCRAWGTVPSMACPHGCEPEEWLPATRLKELSDSIDGGKTASPWEGGPCVACGGTIGPLEKEAGYISCRTCLDTHVERHLQAIFSGDAPAASALGHASRAEGGSL